MLKSFFLASLPLSFFVTLTSAMEHKDIYGLQKPSELGRTQPLKPAAYSKMHAGLDTISTLARHDVFKQAAEHAHAKAHESFELRLHTTLPPHIEKFVPSEIHSTFPKPLLWHAFSGIDEKDSFQKAKAQLNLALRVKDVPDELYSVSIKNMIYFKNRSKCILLSLAAYNFLKPLGETISNPANADSVISAAQCYYWAACAHPLTETKKHLAQKALDVLKQSDLINLQRQHPDLFKSFVKTFMEAFSITTLRDMEARVLSSLK